MIWAIPCKARIWWWKERDGHGFRANYNLGLSSLGLVAGHMDLLYSPNPWELPWCLKHKYMTTGEKVQQSWGRGTGSCFSGWLDDWAHVPSHRIRSSVGGHRQELTAKRQSNPPPWSIHRDIVLWGTSPGFTQHSAGSKGQWVPASLYAGMWYEFPEYCLCRVSQLTSGFQVYGTSVVKVYSAFQGESRKETHSIKC